MAMETVTSADGTTIAFDATGSGPALVLVMGAFCDRHTTNSLTKLLATDFTVYEYDRRGRGDSGDTPPYAVGREIDDLRAVVDATGTVPFVFGHSSGAVLALEAAGRDVPMAKLVAYEPPYIVEGTRERPGADLADRLATLVSGGNRADAARLFLTEAAQVPPPVVAMIDQSPDWPAMVALAHTLQYDIEACDDNEIRPERLGKISTPTLVLGGADSPDWFQATVRATAAAIPGAQYEYLAGQNHGAADDVLAPVLIDFYS
jgi:pimeloyl-ACP methyl ester carboxylesterase